MSRKTPRHIGDIVAAIADRPSNPITRARLMVELEVPASRRGPGWDRHWRELEAYLEAGPQWMAEPETPQQPVTKKRAGPKTSP